MFSPISPDLSNVSEKELTEKIEELMNRSMALRFNYSMHKQLQTLIQIYSAELANRKSKN